MAAGLTNEDLSFANPQSSSSPDIVHIWVNTKLLFLKVLIYNVLIPMYGCIGTGACGGTDTCIIRSTVINQLDDGYMVNYAVEPKTTNTIIEQQDEDWMHRSDSWIMDVPPPSHEGTFAGLI